MKTMTTVALLVISAILPCAVQQKEQRRPGPFLIWGPVRTIRDEQAAVSVKDGEFVEEPRKLSQTIIFNDDGTKQERVVYMPDGTALAKFIDVYNADGRILETTRFDTKGNVQARMVSNYDDQKNLTERVTYQKNGLIQTRQTFVRHGNQSVSEITAYGRNGEIISHTTSTTDIPLNKTESLTFNGDRVSRTEVTATRTPDGGQFFERQRDGKLELRQKIVSQGKDKVEFVNYYEDGTIKSKEQVTNEFDAHGNVIKSVRSVAEGDSTDFKPIEVLYRTIEYYE